MFHCCLEELYMLKALEVHVQYNCSMSNGSRVHTAVA